MFHFKYFLFVRFWVRDCFYILHSDHCLFLLQVLGYLGSLPILLAIRAISTRNREFAKQKWGTTFDAKKNTWWCHMCLWSTLEINRNRMTFQCFRGNHQTDQILKFHVWRQYHAFPLICLYESSLATGTITCISIHSRPYRARPAVLGLFMIAHRTLDISTTNPLVSLGKYQQRPIYHLLAPASTIFNHRF